MCKIAFVGVFVCCCCCWCLHLNECLFGKSTVCVQPLTENDTQFHSYFLSIERQRAVFFFGSSIVYCIYLFLYTFRWNGLFSLNFGVRVCARVSYATQAIGNAVEFSYRFVRVVKTYKNVFMFIFITSIPIWMAIWNEQNGKVMCVRECVRVRVVLISKSRPFSHRNNFLLLLLL